LCVRQVRAQAENRRHLSALESLTQVSAAINARIAESPGVLNDLAEAARRLVGMKVGWVVVLEPDGQSARILSIAGQPATAVGDRALLSEAPALRECVVQGRTIVVEDTERSTLSTLDTSRLRA